MKDQEPPVEAAETEAESPRVEFPCDGCGASMTWDPEADALSCAWCGQVKPVPRAEGTILERPLAAAAGLRRGLAAGGLRVARCSNCGARVSFAERSTAERCVYCGSPQVLAQEANREVLRPESLIPLDLGREQAARAFRRWLRGLWFRPAALNRLKDFDATGVYVPFWTFDCAVHSEWSADAGYYYYVTVPHTVIVNGRPRVRMRRERRIRWVPAWGERDDLFDDLLIPASAGLPPALLEELGEYDLSALVPYRPEYLAGWRAEEYAVGLEEAWRAGQRRVESVQEERCAGDVPGDTHRFLRVRNRIREVRWKHLLLPVWSIQYSYRGEVYTVLVNGQNGRVVGRAPWSWLRILAAVLCLAAAVLGLLALLRSRG